MKSFCADQKQARSPLFLLVILALLSGCSGPASTDSPLSSESTTPMATISAPTVTPASVATNTPDVRISQPGKYKGYSQPLYDEISTTSQYVPMLDGTKLAALILRPAEQWNSGDRRLQTPGPCPGNHHAGYIWSPDPQHAVGGSGDDRQPRYTDTHTDR